MENYINNEGVLFYSILFSISGVKKTQQHLNIKMLLLAFWPASIEP